MRRKRVGNHKQSLRNQSMGRPRRGEHSYWCTRLFIEIMNLWSLSGDYIIEYERAQAKDRYKEKETFVNNWNSI